MANNAYQLTDEDKKKIIQIAREAILAVVHGQDLPKIDLQNLPKNLSVIAASFVTLTIKGRLRGCIGALEASQPLALDVQEHAVAAATQDYRFSPLTKDEFPLINIEVSVLSPMQKLEYSTPSQLIHMLRPGKDGVVIKKGMRRATFLPQVWEKITSAEDFLSQLCIKMGDSPDLWKEKNLEVMIYQVEEIEENEFKE